MRTKIHDLIAAIRRGTHIDAWTGKPTDFDPQEADALTPLPVYVIEQEAFAAMNDGLEVEANRLIAAGHLPCPHSIFCVEFDIDNGEGLTHVVATANAERQPVVVTYSCEYRGTWLGDMVYLTLRDGTFDVSLPHHARGRRDHVFDEMVWRAGVVNRVFKTLLGGMSVRGAVTEDVEAPAALNRARAKKGRPPVRAYTAVRSLTLPRPAPVPAERRGGTHASPVPHHRSGCSFVRRDGRVISRRPTIVNAHKLAPGEVPPAPRVSVSMR